MKSRNGIGLVEAIIALTITGVIASALMRSLVGLERVYREQVERTAASGTLRLAGALFLRELRGLDPGTDLKHLGSAALRYRALRGLYFVCDPPDTLATRVTVGGAAVFERPPDPTVDSVSIFVDGDPSTDVDDRWLAFDLMASATGPHCGGAEGYRLGLGPGGSAALARVAAGAPVRIGPVVEIRGYRGARGAWWVGMRRVPKRPGGRAAIQPVLGPIAPAGLAFAYRDAGDAPTWHPHTVASIEVRIRPAAGTTISPPAQDLRVALRGRGRP